MFSTRSIVALLAFAVAGVVHASPVAVADSSNALAARTYPKVNSDETKLTNSCCTCPKRVDERRC